MQLYRDDDQTSNTKPTGSFAFRVFQEELCRKVSVYFLGSFWSMCRAKFRTTSWNSRRKLRTSDLHPMHLNRSRWIKERKLKAAQLAEYSLFCLNGLGTLGSLEELRGCLLHLVVPSASTSWMIHHLGHFNREKRTMPSPFRGRQPKLV